MNKNMQTKKNNVLIKIIIIAAAVVVLAAAALLVYKYVIKKPVDTEPANTDPNITLLKCHIGMALTDADLQGIKSVVENAAGDKVLEITKGDIPLAEAAYLTDENGESIEAGDIVYITFSILTETEKNDMFKALIKEYKLEEKFAENLNSVFDIRDIYRADYK